MAIFTVYKDKNLAGFSFLSFNEDLDAYTTIYYDGEYIKEYAYVGSRIDEPLSSVTDRFIKSFKFTVEFLSSEKFRSVSKVLIRSIKPKRVVYPLAKTIPCLWMNALNIPIKDWFPFNLFIDEEGNVYYLQPFSDCYFRLVQGLDTGNCPIFKVAETNIPPKALVPFYEQGKDPLGVKDKWLYGVANYSDNGKPVLLDYIVKDYSYAIFWGDLPTESLIFPYASAFYTHPLLYVNPKQVIENGLNNEYLGRFVGFEGDLVPFTNKRRLFIVLNDLDYSAKVQYVRLQKGSFADAFKEKFGYPPKGIDINSFLPSGNESYLNVEYWLAIATNDYYGINAEFLSVNPIVAYTNLYGVYGNSYQNFCVRCDGCVESDFPPINMLLPYPRLGVGVNNAVFPQYFQSSHISLSFPYNGRTKKVEISGVTYELPCCEDAIKGYVAGGAVLKTVLDVIPPSEAINYANTFNYYGMIFVDYGNYILYNTVYRNATKRMLGVDPCYLMNCLPVLSTAILAEGEKIDYPAVYAYLKKYELYSSFIEDDYDDILGVFPYVVRGIPNFSVRKEVVNIVVEG